jgi:hypothetical protein
MRVTRINEDLVEEHGFSDPYLIATGIFHLGSCGCPDVKPIRRVIGSRSSADWVNHAVVKEFQDS